MIAASLILIATALAPPVQGATDEAIVKGLHLFARCWRTPTGDTPYMIWTIGSRDPAPVGEEWIIRGEYIGFEGLPIQPSATFVKPVAASDPDLVGGSMVEQPQGEKAQFAVIRGHLDKVETFVEVLSLGDVVLVRARRPKGELGPVYHLQIGKPLKLSTPSGLTIEIPTQGADTSIRYGALGAKPIAALVFKTNFKESEEQLPSSPLYKKYGSGPIAIEARLKGIPTPFSHGFAGGNYVVESQGFDLKPGVVKDVGVEIVQSVVLQSFPLTFRVPVRESKTGSRGVSG